MNTMIEFIIINILYVASVMIITEVMHEASHLIAALIYGFRSFEITLFENKYGYLCITNKKETLILNIGITPIISKRSYVGVVGKKNQKGEHGKIHIHLAGLYSHIIMLMISLLVPLNIGVIVFVINGFFILFCCGSDIEKASELITNKIYDK